MAQGQDDVWTSLVPKHTTPSHTDLHLDSPGFSPTLFFARLQPLLLDNISAPFTSLFSVDENSNVRGSNSEINRPNPVHDSHILWQTEDLKPKTPVCGRHSTNVSSMVHNKGTCCGIKLKIKISNWPWIGNRVTNLYVLLNDCVVVFEKVWQENFHS